MDRRDWLAGLEAGDEVAVGYGYGRKIRFSKVDRMTQTMIVVGGDRFWRKNGDAVGQSWDVTGLMEPTAELKLKANAQRARKQLADTAWSMLTDEAAIVVAAAVAAADRKKLAGE